MKKILIVVLLVAAGGIIYVAQNNKSASPPHEEGSGEVTPSPPPAAADHEEQMGDILEPTAPPVSPNPAPVKDDIGDVDVAPTKVFNLTGKNFSFSQTEIRVKKGDRVVINFESTDGFHDWVVDEFNAHTERVNPGTKTSVEFIADKSGTFEYYCSVSIHRASGMKGQLIVE